MGMPKYEEQLAFTVIISKEGQPDHEFKVYTNGATDGFPKGEGIKVSISNKIPVFIHKAYIQGENKARCSTWLDIIELHHKYGKEHNLC